MNPHWRAGHGYREGRQAPRVDTDVMPWAQAMCRAVLDAHPNRMVCAMAALTVACDYATRCNYSLDDLRASAQETFKHRNQLLPVNVIPTAESIVRDYGNTPGFDAVCDALNDAAAEGSLTVKAMVGACMVVAGRLVAFSETRLPEFLAAVTVVHARHREWWTAPTESESA